MPTIAVTGATGNIGSRVARRLADAGIAQRLVVRDPTRSPAFAGSETTRAEFADAAAVRAALSGIETALMVSASESADRVAQHFTFIDAAAAAGVRHLVYTSFFGASADATFTLARDHWATESHIRGSGMAFTFLRDNMYADFLKYLVGEDGVIRGPAADGRAAFVTQDDIADAAVAVLLSPAAHSGATYDLTGPSSLSLAEVAALMGAATGRDVRFHNETLEEAYESRASYGAPDWQVEAWVSTYTAIAAGELDGVSSAILDLTGHPATSVAELLASSSA